MHAIITCHATWSLCTSETNENEKKTNNNSIAIKIAFNLKNPWKRYPGTPLYVSVENTFDESWARGLDHWVSHLTISAH